MVVVGRLYLPPTRWNYANDRHIVSGNIFYSVRITKFCGHQHFWQNNTFFQSNNMRAV